MYLILSGILILQFPAKGGGGGGEGFLLEMFYELIFHILSLLKF